MPTGSPRVRVRVTPGRPLSMGTSGRRRASSHLPGVAEGKCTGTAKAPWPPVPQQAAGLGTLSMRPAARTLSLESQALGSGGRPPWTPPPLELGVFLVPKMGLILSQRAVATSHPTK